MRILLRHKFLKLAGGAEVFFHEVGRVLREQGYEVRFLATGEPMDVE